MNHKFRPNQSVFSGMQATERHSQTHRKSSKTYQGASFPKPTGWSKITNQETAQYKDLRNEEMMVK